MPRKVRQLKADLRRVGFVERKAKGSHTFWTHPLLPGGEITLSGNDGADAQPYQERDIRNALERLARAREKRS